MSTGDAAILYIWMLPFLIIMYFLKRALLRFKRMRPTFERGRETDRFEDGELETPGEIASAKFGIFWDFFSFLVFHKFISLTKNVFNWHTVFIMSVIWFVHAFFFVGVSAVTKYYDER